jgi:glycosyltransferase involved in cell wall biosynthesis
MTLDTQGRRLFYFCYDHDKPNGGQKDTYRHVDVLRACGVDAFVFHLTRDRPLEWFANTTPVINKQEFRALYRLDTDIVVVPEDLGTDMFELPGQKVIFNKNLYYGFRSFGDPPFDGRDPYVDDDVIGVMTVSEHNLMHLRYAYPTATIALVTVGVPPARFGRRPFAEKRRMLAFSGKVPGHVRTLYHMVRARAAAGLNDTGDIEWKKLSGLTESQVAATLADARAFICLSTEEGIVRTLLEAMASGCIICSYAHGPVAEYLPGECQFAMGDLVSAARFLERLTAKSAVDDAYWNDLSQLCFTHALRYGEAQERDSVIAAWSAILTRSRDAVCR